MDITIGNILAFLVILFAINGIATGIGLTDTSKMNTFNPLGTDTNYANLTDQYQSGILTVLGTNPEDPGDTATTDSGIISGVPFTADINTQANTFWTMLKGLTFGYASIILLLPIGLAMSFLLIGIIAFIQFGAIIYLLLYVFSIIRGGGGL